MKIIRQIYLLIIICILICSSKSASIAQSSGDDKIDIKNKFSDNSNDPGLDILNSDINDDNYSPGERRRVTKTVFIAPDLPDCSPGYREDEKQRCNKVNKELIINETAYILFLSEKLNNVLFPSDTNKPTTKNESQTIEITVIEDPFRLKLPLNIDNDKSANNNTENIAVVSSTSAALSSEEPSTLLPETTTDHYQVHHDDDDDDDDKNIEENNASNASSIIINKPNNNTVINDNKNINEDKLFDDSLDTKLADVKNKSTTTELPVIEYIDETNNFSYSDLVNYKIPELDDALLNNKTNKNTMGIKLIDENKNNSQTTTAELSTNVDSINISSSTIDNISSTTDIISSSQDTISESISNSHVTSENSVKFISNTTESVDYSNYTTVNVDDVMINLKEEEEEKENVDDSNNSYSNNSTNNTTDNYQNIYQDKYSGNEPDDSKESDELLMHSETGITVTIPPSSHEQLLSTPTEVDTATTGSTISSEASINDDFIRETTLLNLNNNNNTKILINNNHDKKIVLNNTNINNDYFENINMSFPVEITSISTNNNNAEEKYINENYDDKIKKITQVSELPNKQQLFTSAIVSNVNSELSDIKNDFVKFEESPFVKVFDKLFPSLSSSSSSSSPATMTTKTTTNKPNIFHFPTSKSDKLKPENIDNIMEASSTNSAEIIIPDNEKNKASSVELINHHRHKGTDDIEIKYLSSTIANSVKEQYDIVNNFPSSINIPDEIKHHVNNARPLKTFDNERKKINSRIKFPDNTRPQNSGNQIKFPSKDANSISTSNDNKDRYNYHLNSQHNKYNNNNNEDQKNQQQQNWLWRAKHEKSLKQRSSPLHFWSRLPLNKANLNHSIHSTAGVADRRKGRTKTSRRFNLYEGVSPEDETRAFAITSSLNR